MNEEYRPYSGGNLASSAYAMPCGMTTAPTVMPVESYKLASVYILTSSKGVSLTCHEIPNQPLYIVIPDPVEKRKEPPDITANQRSGGHVTSKPTAHSGLMLVIAICSGLICHDRQSWT